MYELFTQNRITIDSDESLLLFLNNKSNNNINLDLVDYNLTDIYITDTILTTNMITLFNKLLKKFSEMINSIDFYHCKLTSTKVTQLFKDLSLPKLSLLSLIDNDFSDMIDISMFLNSTILEVFIFIDFKLTSKTVTQFFKDVSLPNLTRLGLSGNDFSDTIDISMFLNSIQQLDEFHLTDCKLTSTTLTQLFTDVSLPNLTSLYLDKNDFSNDMIDFTSLINNLGQITSLKLTNCNLSSALIKQLFNEASLSTLDELDLVRNDISNNITDINSNINKANMLWGLYLFDCKLTSTLVTQLFDGVTLPNLIQLDLSNNDFSSNMIDISMFLNSCAENLRRLYFKDCNLTSMSVTKLFAGVTLSNLTSLVLSNNDFSNDMIDISDFLNTATELNNISLDNCSLTTKSLTQIFKNVQLNSLCYLDLSNNDLSGIVNNNLNDFLNSTSQLIQLHLVNCNLTSTSIFNIFNSINLSGLYNKEINNENEFVNLGISKGGYDGISFLIYMIDLRCNNIVIDSNMIKLIRDGNINNCRLNIDKTAIQTDYYNEFIQVCADKNIDITLDDECTNNITSSSANLQNNNSTISIPMKSGNDNPTLLIPTNAKNSKSTLSIPTNAKNSKSALLITTNAKNSKSTFSITTNAKNGNSTSSKLTQSKHSNSTSSIPTQSKHGHSTSSSIPTQSKNNSTKSTVTNNTKKSKNIYLFFILIVILLFVAIMIYLIIRKRK